MADIVLEGLRKDFPNGQVALDGVDLQVADGELVVLVGPSGCGKSTTLRLVAGLESPTAGQIRIGGRDVTSLTPQERDVAMVFQTYALYPHLRVRENLGFGLRMRGVGRAERVRRVEDAARLLGIEALLDRRPVELSGGQRQRVALGRAIVREPRAFLLDEPLSNLDAKLRVQTRTELSRLHRRLRATMLYVTHDQEEAMTLGDRIALMRGGRLLQVAPPLEVYERPASAFVGEFIGSPAMNLLPCRLTGEDGRPRLEGPGFSLDAAARDPAAQLPADLLLGIRPHDLLPAPEPEADLAGRVDVVEALGSGVLLHVLLDGAGDRTPALRVLLPVEERPKAGDHLPLRLRRDRAHLFATTSGDRLTSVTLA